MCDIPAPSSYRIARLLSVPKERLETLEEIKAGVVPGSVSQKSGRGLWVNSTDHDCLPIKGASPSDRLIITLNRRPKETVIQSTPNKFLAVALVPSRVGKGSARSCITRLPFSSLEALHTVAVGTTGHGFDRSSTGE